MSETGIQQITTPPPPSEFFQRCAFISVDIQDGKRGRPLGSDDELPEPWRKMGFTAEDVNAAGAHGHDVALPNAVRVAEACRRLDLPMIFVHWGCQFEDGMDLDPTVRGLHKPENLARGPIGSHISNPGSRPYRGFNVQKGEYVIAKTAQDTFASSQVQFVLHNLGVENLILIGGHTGACLGKTSASARRLGFKRLCIHDATSSARESTRLAEIVRTEYEYVLSTEAFERQVEMLVSTRAR